ncbi:MAG TPA: hypothetical protein VGW96_00690 [Candidatus Eremiobacteraceae bacterium]|jgi:hypothetical protein|nr:hypothetical protein [Candidatus Eremiobacteraceae bacterium]
MRTRQFISLFAVTAMLILGTAGSAVAIEHATTPQNDETRDNLVGEGTLIRIVMLQTVTTAHCKVGDKFTFRVVDDVKAGSRIAIPAGTTGSGKVTICSPAHGGRQNGKLKVEFDPVLLADGTQLFVAITRDSVVADANDSNGTAPALEDIANMTIPGFFLIDFLRKGDDVTLGANQPFHIAVTEDAFLSQ